MKIDMFWAISSTEIWFQSEVSTTGHGGLYRDLHVLAYTSVWQTGNLGKFETNEKSFDLLIKSFSCNIAICNMQIGPWFWFPIPKPGFGHTLVRGNLVYIVSLNKG